MKKLCFLISIISLVLLGQYILAQTTADPDGQPGSKAMPWLLLLLDNTPPNVNISSPANNSNYFQGETISFGGSAVDSGVALTGSSLTWSSDIEGQLGTGTALSLSNLSIGNHTITLKAVDNEGAEASDSVKINVFDPNIPDSLSIISKPCIILNDGKYAATIEVTVFPISQEYGTISDGTAVDFEAISGSAVLSDYSTETAGGEASVQLTSSSAETVILKATVQGTEISNTVDITVVSDFNTVFSKTPDFDGSISNGFVLPGSILSFTIQNNSCATFNLKKYEMRYYEDLLISITDDSLLSDGQLTVGESVTIAIEFGTGPSFLINNLLSVFILNDPDVLQDFEISYDWELYE